VIVPRRTRRPPRRAAKAARPRSDVGRTVAGRAPAGASGVSTVTGPRRPVAAFGPRRPVAAFGPRRPVAAFGPRRPVRPRACGGPCDGAPPGSPDRRGSPSGAGTRGDGLACGCSADRDVSRMASPAGTEGRPDRARAGWTLGVRPAYVTSAAPEPAGAGPAGGRTPGGTKPTPPVPPRATVGARPGVAPRAPARAHPQRRPPVRSGETAGTPLNRPGGPVLRFAAPEEAALGFGSPHFPGPCAPGARVGRTAAARKDHGIHSLWISRG